MTTGVAASEISAEMDDLGSADDFAADCWNAEPEDAELLEELEIADRHRRQLMAHQTMLVAEVMRRKLYRSGGHSSVFGLLRARLGWSEGECRDAVAIVRAAQASESMCSAVDNATLPVSHTAVLARSINALAQSPTADHDLIDRDVAGIVVAHDPEYDQFSKSVRRWETVVDPARSQRSAETAHDRRDVAIRPTEHGVTITARLGAIDGARAVVSPTPNTKPIAVPHSPPVTSIAKGTRSCPERLRTVEPTDWLRSFTSPRPLHRELDCLLRRCRFSSTSARSPTRSRGSVCTRKRPTTRSPTRTGRGGAAKRATESSSTRHRL